MAHLLQEFTWDPSDRCLYLVYIGSFNDRYENISIVGKAVVNESHLLDLTRSPWWYSRTEKNRALL